MVKREWPFASLARHFHLARPRMPVLVTSLNPNTSLNVAPFNWNTPLSVDPPLFILALQERPRRSDTLGNIEVTGEFVVNFPGLNLAEQIIVTSYEHKPDTSKFDYARFTPLPSRVIGVSGIAECRAHLECVVAEILRPANTDHAIVVGRVVAACYDPAAWTEELVPKLESDSPAVHMGQRNAPEGQTHMFSSLTGITEMFIPFVERK